MLSLKQLSGMNEETSRLASAFGLVRVIFFNSIWLLSRSIKMVLILNVEMVACILRGKQRPGNGQPKVQNVFNHFGVWVVDMNGLIQEEMGIR